MTNFFQRYSRWTLYLMVTDYVSIVICFGLALRLRFRPDLTTVLDLPTRHMLPQAVVIFFYALAVLVVFAAVGLYRRKTLLSRLWHATGIVQGMSVAGLAYIAIQYLTKSPLFVESRFVILMWTVTTIAALGLHRLGLAPWIWRLATRADLQRRVVLIGAGDVGKRFAGLCRTGGQYAGLEVVGFISDVVPKGTPVFENLACMGQIADLADLVQSHSLEGAVITNPMGASYQQLMDIIERCVRLFGWVDVHADKSAVLHENLDPDTYFDIPFVRMRELPHGALIRIYKRTFDFCAALGAIVALAPLLLAVAALVKLTSPGPVLYVTQRVGLRGRPFKFYKFRSMRVGADRDPQRLAQVLAAMRDENARGGKIVNRAFFTPIGAFIRKWAIDELPQLFNVLRGDMSLVGPRPVPPEEYEVNDEWQKRRFDILPGCTGLWKIFVSQGNASFSHAVLYDLYYARNMTPLMDLYVILGTIRVILAGRADG